MVEPPDGAEINYKWEFHRLRDGCGAGSLPSLLGRSIDAVGNYGYWVNRSDGRFAMELMTERQGGNLPPW